MATKVNIAARDTVDIRQDVVSKDEADTYELDFRAWQEDNSTITSVTWKVEYGSVGVSNQTLTSGVASALLSFSQEGKALLSVIADTGTQKKKMWLDFIIKDHTIYVDDYGMGNYV